MSLRFVSKIFCSSVLFFIVLSTCVGSMTQSVSAHEVYVLSPAQITQAMGVPPFDMLHVAYINLGQFVFWAFITIASIISVFLISISRFLERKLDPLLIRMRSYAPFVARVTVGLSFLAAAYYQANYGPELPIVNIYGGLSGVTTGILIVIGCMTICGLYARIAAFVALCMYGIAVWFHGWYMLTYINYLGEIIVLLTLGAHNLSLDHLFSHKKPKIKKTTDIVSRIQAYIAPRSFAILRICFGISLIFASGYAKIVYNNLGLFTVMKYHLDTILGFEAHFLVLGAAIIEIVIGVFIVLGIEIRFAAFFFEFWLTLSLCFFGEVVWPHIILIGIPIALIMYGYDAYSVEGYLFRNKKYEPLL